MSAVFKRVTLIATVTLLLAFSAFAQDRPSAKSDEGVIVILEQVPSGKKLSTRTDGKGNFSFSDVEAGTYRLLIGCAEQKSQNEKRDCLAEMRIVISDKSKGIVTGIIQKTENK
jgi:hypothetical protein